MNFKKEKLLEQIEVLKKEVESIDGKKRWRARREPYHFAYTEGVESSRDVEDKYDNHRYDTRNYFKTKEEAERHSRFLRATAELQDHIDECGMPKLKEYYYYISDSCNEWNETKCSMREDILHDHNQCVTGQFMAIDSTEEQRGKRIGLLRNIKNLTK